MALLVFLAAAAGAGVVAADFVAFDDGLIGAIGGAVAAHHLQLRELFFLFALDVAREVLHGGLGHGALLIGGGRRSVLLLAFLALLVAVFIQVEWQLRAASLPWLLGDLQEEQQADRLVLNAVHHVLEQREGLFFVFDQRVFLAVAPETNAFFEMVHREQVVFPLVVDDLEHDPALALAHQVRANEVLFLLVLLRQLFEYSLFDCFALKAGEVADVDFVTELAEDIGAKAGKIPSVGMRAFGTANVDESAERAAHHFEYTLFLI